MFGKKGVRKITPDERTFALCFARTMSVRQSCAAAGFERRTSFARASRLLERGDVRSLVRASILGESSGVFPAGRAAPAPGGIADEAPDANAAPVSLEIVRDAPNENGGPTPESGASAKGEAKNCPSTGQTPTAPRASDTGVPAPSAAEREDGGEATQSPDCEAQTAPDGGAIPSPHSEAQTAPDAEATTSPDVEPASDEGDEAALFLDRIERRILSEYEKIAFAPATKESDVKIADKLRALDQYRAIVERQAQRIADAAGAERLAADRLTVVYDYGDEREPR